MARVYIAVYLSSANDGWPFDDGDDPSFRASQRFSPRGGVLTWGVCRRDVRNALEAGDLVVFFAADRLQERRPEPARYFFVGFATVADKVTQADIWRRSDLSVFRKYGNLLIRPAAGGFEHFEPTLPARRWHGDWYWRMTAGGLKRRGWRVNERSRVTTEQIGRLPFAQNYVLFEKERAGTMILRHPPVVATCATAGQSQAWERTAFARELVSWLQKNTDRTLRTTNVQRAHRHIVIKGSDPERWRQVLRSLCDQHGLAQRARKSLDHRADHGPSVKDTGRRSC